MKPKQVLKIGLVTVVGVFLYRAVVDGNYSMAAMQAWYSFSACSLVAAVEWFRRTKPIVEDVYEDMCPLCGEIGGTGCGVPGCGLVYGEEEYPNLDPIRNSLLSRSVEAPKDPEELVEAAADVISGDANVIKSLESEIRRLSSVRREHFEPLSKQELEAEFLRQACPENRTVAALDGFLCGARYAEKRHLRNPTSLQDNSAEPKS